MYIGVIDPNGGINILWPLFGIANQMLAGIALSIATGALVKKARPRHWFVTLLPLAWLAVVTTTAAWQKIFSANPKLGFFAAANDLSAKLSAGTLPPARAAVAPELIFNQQLDGWLTAVFVTALWLVVFDALRTAWRQLRGLPTLPSSEVPHAPTALAGENLGAAVTVAP